LKSDESFIVTLYNNKKYYHTWVRSGKLNEKTLKNTGLGNGLLA
jgi:hypothetical protein